MGAGQQQLARRPSPPSSDRSEESDDGGRTSDTLDPTEAVRESAQTESEDWAVNRNV